MNEADFRLVAAVPESGRRPILFAAEQLALCLQAAQGKRCPIRVRFIGRDDDHIPAGAALIATLVDDVATSAPIEDVEREWRARVARFRCAGHDRVLLCTVFRSVRDRVGGSDKLERIRRLNQLLLELSRTENAEVVDVDRLLSLCGARTLDTDFSCSTELAARLAGHAVTAAILNGEFAEKLGPAVQQRAAGLHGGIRDIGRIFAHYAKERLAS